MQEPTLLKLSRLFVHLADLSAQVFPYDIACAWGARVIAEFQAQARLEDTAGPGVVQPTPYMHGLDSELSQARLQLGFCKYELVFSGAPSPFRMLLVIVKNR